MSINDLCMAQEQWALGILLRTNVLESCVIHGDVLHEGSEDVDAAYKYANTIFSRNAGDTPFEDRTEMTDTIKSVFEEYCGCDVCPSCANA